MLATKSALIAGAVMFVPIHPLHAEGCLQKFSCKLYGECRLPCFDAFMTTPTPILPSAVVPPSKEDRSATAPASLSTGAPKPPPTAKRRNVTAARQIKMSFSNSPPKIVTGSDTSSLAQLAGKPVSFGLNGSPGQSIGRKIFRKLGIPINETPLSLENAVDGIASGDIAAVLVISEHDAVHVAALRSPSLRLLPVPSSAPTHEANLDRH